MISINKNNINYISKALDLHHCLNEFTEQNITAGKTVYVLHLNSTTTDRELFVKKIYKNFRDRVKANAKSAYNIEAGVGGIEIGENGYWHIHMLVTFRTNYCKTSIYNHTTALRELWHRLNEQYTHIELQGNSNLILTQLRISQKNRCIKYISKPVKHNRKGSGLIDYLPKGFNTKESPRCTLGRASKHWNTKDMPSWRLTDKQIAESLKTVWNEYYGADKLDTLELTAREYEFLVQ